MKRLNPDNVQKREELILDTAYAQLKSGGYASMTMDRIAEKVPFSKGTLYNHFQSREDLMLGLICRFIRVCHNLFSRATLFRGCPRERFIAVCVAADIDSRLNESGLEFMASASLLAAASSERRDTFLRLHNEIYGLFIGIVRDAISRGDLPEGTEADLVTNSAWSLYVGAQELHERNFVYPDLQTDAFEKKRLEMFHALLDGFQWTPRSHELDSDAIRKRVLEEIFPDESKRLAARRS